MKKGFTLVELLAVLVITAIIAIVAVPMVVNLVKHSKEESDKRSIDNYMSAVNIAITNHNKQTSGREIDNVMCNIESNGDLNCNGTIVNVNINKTSITGGTVFINNYAVTNYVSLEIGDKKYNEFKGTKIAAGSNDTHKGIVYLNPTDLGAVCNETLASQNVNTYGTPTGVNSGCMKFYIYDDSGTNYKMILDHNTSGNVAWISEADYLAAGGNQTDWNNGIRNNKGPVTANARLADDTTGWVGNPRLIIADEIATITGVTSASGWNSTNPASEWFCLDIGCNIDDENTSNYQWLYDYTYNCINYGCHAEDNNTYPYPTKTSGTSNYILGYWTSSAHANYSSGAWYVTYQAELGDDNGVHETVDGVRPVITLSKSIFN